MVRAKAAPAGTAARSNPEGFPTVRFTVTTTNETDAETARRIAAGDAAAFDRLYGDNVDRIYAVCLRMAGDAERARSLTQDAFVRAWERMGTFRGESRLSSWLHRIAVNVAIESGRSGQRWRRLLVADEALAGRGPARERDPGLAVDLERAIAGLPPGARRMLVLRDVEGCSYEEVAELTGAALGTVKSQISRARRLVREALER
jgi:RNA polymerase sigma-70 factor (ECF subfamily)